MSAGPNAQDRSDAEVFQELQAFIRSRIPDNDSVFAIVVRFPHRASGGHVVAQYCSNIDGTQVASWFHLQAKRWGYGSPANP